MNLLQISTSYSENKKITSSKILSTVVDNGKIENEVINIYPDVEYQKVYYWGGAVTEAVGTVLSSMSDEKSDEIINSVFGKDGLKYNAIRTHIDSCDFSTSQYCAMNDSSDTELSSFSISRDKKCIIPWIKKAYIAAGTEIPVMLTPWSPPSFMKTNNSRIGGGFLKEEYYSLWAKYICKYIASYRKEGINVKMLSIQNEPNASQTWDSCLFSPSDESRFIETSLYPELINSGLSDMELYIWDHNKERAYDRALTTINSNSSDYISGVAVHWYSGDHFDALSLIHDRFPNKKIIFTEGCIEYSRYDANQITNAQKYAHDMIGNLSHGLNGFYDWNICLNSDGGPNYVNNLCEAPIMCGHDGTIEYKLSYDYIGHFTKYIEPGARKIATTKFSDIIDVVAFKNPDSSLVLVILNRDCRPHKFVVRLSGYTSETTIESYSISTILIN